jgi:E3 ubiquitin-protein ligase HERC2
VYKFSAALKMFQRVELKCAVGSVACGVGHVLVVDRAQGIVYAWGTDNSCGQLGNGGFETCSTPQMLKLGSVGGSGNVVADKVCAGDRCSAVVANKGALVLTWGHSAQLGYAVEDGAAGQSVPRVVDQWDDGFQAPASIDDLAFGESFAVALASDGLLYMWGRAFFSGGADHTDAEFVSLRPRLLVGVARDNHKVRRVACGRDMVLVSTSTGKVLAWGPNKEGLLGVGSHKAHLEPYLVKKFRNIKVKEVQCGTGHCMALDGSGVLYTWGARGVGQKLSSSLAQQLVPAPAKALGSNVRVRKGVYLYVYVCYEYVCV